MPRTFITTASIASAVFTTGCQEEPYSGGTYKSVAYYTFEKIGVKDHFSFGAEGLTYNGVLQDLETEIVTSGTVYLEWWFNGSLIGTTTFTISEGTVLRLTREGGFVPPDGQSGSYFTVPKLNPDGNTFKIVIETRDYGKGGNGNNLILKPSQNINFTF